VKSSSFMCKFIENYAHEKTLHSCGHAGFKFFKLFLA